MKIIGEISIDDYLAAQQLLSSNPAWVRQCSFLFWFLSMLTFDVICGHLGGVGTMGIAAFGIVVWYALLLAFQKTMRAALLRSYRRAAPAPNLGQGEYEIVEQEIRFKGTTFDCTVPIKNIADVKARNGTTVLVFGNRSGFIIPKTISAGDLGLFIETLKARCALAEKVK